YYLSNIKEKDVLDGTVIVINKNGTIGELIPYGLKDPRGMVIYNDQLYVADVNSVAVCDIATKSIIYRYNITGAFLINDICSDGSGNFYATDFEANKIYKIETAQQRAYALNIKGSLDKPCGIYYDNENDRLIVLPYTDNTPIYEVTLSDLKIDVIKQTNYSNFYGITRDRKGNFLVSSWGDLALNGGKIYKFAPDFSGSPVTISSGHNGPADIFFNLMTDTLMIPNLSSNKIEFLYFPSIPEEPELSSPDNNDKNLETNLILNWKRSAGAESYRVEISESNSFLSLFKETEVSGYSATITGFVEGITYYWRVRSQNAAGNSNWSPVWSFSIAPAKIEPPKLQKPDSNATLVNVQPTFQWKNGNVDSYQIEISSDPAFAGTPVFNKEGILVTAIKLQDISLLYGTTYYWRAKSIKGASTSPWSNVWNFKTQDSVPDKVELLLPEDNATDIALKPVFSWTTSARAERYDIVYSLVSDFSTNATERFIEGGSSSTFIPGDDLLQDTTYFWKVRAQNATGDGEWSPTRTFKTKSLISVRDLLPLDELTYFSINPNPSDGNEIKLTIILIEPIFLKIELFDILGNKISEISDVGSSEKTEKTINVTSLNNGVYYLVLKSENKAAARKLIIQK
ncbi:MAG: large repetitive protein, partial [Bacteroidota bacterium]|nr:large repetitive protein [Bacteroidota bacterium]